ncbi:MAG: efflux RND transporter periplasmic adaptor subunit, partial [Actinomycetota bacterium]
AVAEARGALQSAEAARDVAQLERDRQAELVARDTVAQAVLDNVEAELAAREGDVVRLSAALDRAEINLSYTEIAAPFDGIIGPAAFDAGAFINPQSGALAAMTKLDPIHAEFQVPTASLRDYLENVDAGTASNIAAVTLRLANGTVYDTPGDVDFVDTTVTTGTDSV